jgi:hypothetical protein
VAFCSLAILGRFGRAFWDAGTFSSYTSFLLLERPAFSLVALGAALAFGTAAGALAQGTGAAGGAGGGAGGLLAISG